jgi:GNAT superfamily N-acetyltransferase
MTVASIALSVANRYLRVMSRSSAESLDPLQAAMHRNHIAALERVAHLNAGAATVTLGPFYLVDAATPEAPFFNQVVVVGEQARQSHLEAVERWFSARGGPFRLMLRDDTDGSLIESAEAAGYVADYTEPALFLERPKKALEPPDPLTIREVATDADLIRYGGIGWQNDGLERIGIGIARTARDLGFTMLLGEIEREAVAVSMAVVTDSLVGVYNVGVEPRFRRNGFGTAMVWAAIRAGRRLGATAAWIGSTPMSHGLYERIGFRRRYEYKALMRV